ncbi:UDP-glucose 4-epimerase GalE [Nocardioides nitrophenolicus]|uniref:UDP-glucose 4-epimerase GalE n=1 Tax=Nocardioides nitrophenolicus TaxID=60489 RepID=UPI00195AFD66|nr:UDP-glucose 4-epimerase GalE [Nocardioides nitrophenolicus]MBM7520317.1 UDP-glucose 4-epimerase [Nocardioides nitrophenolicus]
MKVLVTGGAGYIGSTVVSALLDAGHRPIILDDLSSGRAEFVRGLPFHRGDIADQPLIRRILTAHPDLRSVVHCAARVVVPESVTDPVGYYRTNVAGTLELAAALADGGVRDLVFSSSASVYAAGPDAGQALGLDEDAPLGPSSPYARTKAMMEAVLADVSAVTGLRTLALRYFNPMGADPALRTGPQQPVPAHVLGRLVECARRGEPFRLTGVDYPTPDGTGIRDYVHVWDLARAHVAAVEDFDRALAGSRHQVINLGTGRGTSVRELVDTFAAVSRRSVEVVEAPRRDGDAVGGYARCERAAELLDWKAELDLAAGVRDALAWSVHRGSVLPDLATAVR